jgi:predicted nucleotidyltransferase
MVVHELKNSALLNRAVAGSRVWGTAHEASDWDLVVVLKAR